METALYFPYIRVPQTSWFTQILLYWDSGASIVPGSMLENREELGTYMSELVRERLMQLVRPNELLSHSARAFDEQFLVLVDGYQPPPQAEQRRVRLHAEKARDELFWELEYRGLAERRGRADPNWLDVWWEVEETIAGLYMAYLAGALSGVNDSFFPVTDAVSSIASLGPMDGDTATRLRALRYAAIMEALPVPSRPVPAIEMASFKDKHGDELGRLRRYLDGQLADLAMIQDDYLRQVKTDGVFQAIRDDVAVLREQMAKRAWPKIVFAGIGGVVGSALGLASAIATGGHALALGLAVGSGALGLSLASYQAAEIIGSPRFDMRRPLVYAAMAQTLSETSR